MTKPQYSGPWRKIRLEVLERDGYRCQVKLNVCTGKATQVDHIIPIALEGAWFDLENLRSSCQSCNLARRGRRRVVYITHRW